MSRLKDTMIFITVKKTDRTAQYKNEDGENKTEYGWDTGRFTDSTPEMENIPKEKEEADSLPSDEISVLFKKVYDLWMNKLRPRISDSSDGGAFQNHMILIVCVLIKNTIIYKHLIG